MRRRKQTGTMVKALLFRDSSQQKTKTELHVVYCTQQVYSVVEHLCAEDNLYDPFFHNICLKLPDDIKSGKSPIFFPSLFSL